jgi:hypothetical protein
MSGAFAASHDGQVASSLAPHSPQNFLPASFSVPQLVQRIVSWTLGV